jgi:hypothetical protein
LSFLRGNAASRWLPRDALGYLRRHASRPTCWEEEAGGSAGASVAGTVAKKARQRKSHIITLILACTCLKQAFEFQSTV